MKMQKIEKVSEYLHDTLAASQELEGGLFVDICVMSNFGDSFTVRKDFYTVENGIVYSVNNGLKHQTTDSLWNVKRDCKRVGEYDPHEYYHFVAKNYTFDEFVKLLQL